MANAVHPPITASGTITTFIPLSTAWPSLSQCSSLFVIPVNETLLQMYAFDPGYGLNQGGIAKSCQPPEVTAWWKQAQGETTRTELGGHTMICPEANTTAAVIPANSFTTRIACCPSDYTFFTWANAPFPSQCTSSLPPQLLTYVQPVLGLGPDWTTATSALTTQSGVIAVQVNGFLFASASSTGSFSTTFVSPSSTSTGTSALKTIEQISSTSATLSTITSSPNSAIPSNSPSDGGMSRGDKISLGVGLGVGVPTLIVAIIGIAIKFLPKRRKIPETRVENNRRG
ncbi:hypothetical protein DL98DRAFT_656147 [Cadophora sp. DSE1049]|nr:hypothetical protein DL98DRAFT_656147 [Cadophora sp. DSE1049]